MDVVARAFLVAREDRLDGITQGLLIAWRDFAPLCRHCLEEIVYGDDVPQRGINGVEFRYLATVGKAVGQHAVGDRACPSKQDVVGFVESASRQAEATQRNEGIASPVSEPRIPRDDGLACAPANQVGICRAVQAGREVLTTLALSGA